MGRTVNSLYGVNGYSTIIRFRVASSGTLKMPKLPAAASEELEGLHTLSVSLPPSGERLHQGGEHLRRSEKLRFYEHKHAHNSMPPFSLPLPAGMMPPDGGRCIPQVSQIARG